MRISAVAFLMILTTMFLSACAQQQTMASVENRGSNYYGRNASYASAAASAPTQQAVAVASVASSDLAAPSPAKNPYKSSITVQTARWQWPVNGKVIQAFGPQANGVASEGITIAAAEGTPIHAAQAGEVAFVGQNVRDYGNMVILRHPDGALTSYAHARNITVKKGDTVAAGAVIAYVGQSGSAKTPQLHFALREGDRAVDPLGKLPQNVAAN